MNVLICDDEPQELELLSSYCRKYALKKEINLTINTVSSEKSLFDYFKNSIPDVLFLDIYINNSNGMDIAKELRSNGYNNPIIFVTTSMEYAWLGFRVDAMDYLIKPVTYELFDEAFSKSCQNFITEIKYLDIIADRMHVKIFYKDIYYIETSNRTTKISTTNGIYNTRVPISTLDEQLCKEENFYRCHRCCICNFSKVQTIEESVIRLTNGENIPVRVKDSKTVQKEFSDFSFNLLRKKTADHKD